MINYEDVKARHSIESVLEKRGIRYTRRCIIPCPIHQEQHGTSFSWDPKRQLWNCFGRCGRGGSVIDLVMVWDGVERDAACEILEGRPLTEAERHAPCAQRPAPSPELHAVRELPSVPNLDTGTEADWWQLARIRRLPSIQGIAAAVEAEVLRFATVYRQRAWVVLDVSNPCNVQCSRLDGEKWFNGDKLVGVKGNWAKWPVGLSVAIKHPAAKIALVEGRGDFIAAYEMHVHGKLPGVPVAMFGASMPIHDSALAFLEGRHVTLLQQNDKAGHAAAVRWTSQLRAAGATVAVKVVPGEGNDLNDWLSANPDSLQ